MAYQYAGRYIEALLKNVNGRPRLLASTLVTIYESDGTTEATVYTDRTMATEAANPVMTDTLGNLAVWLEPGSYYGAPIIDGVAQVAFPMHVDIDPAEADAPTATDVTVTPAGGIAATNVQSALVELDTEKATTGSVTTVSTALTAHEGDAADAHDASAVSFVPAGTVAATDVQAAIVEVSGDVTAEASARATADALLIPLTQKGAANGVATLGADSKIPSAQLPSLAISEFLGTTASQAAMLALAGQRGDYTVRTDTAPSSTWILTTDDPTQLANWLQISTVTDAVSSVNGRTGAVVGLAEASAVVAKSLYDANSVVIAQTDDTPEVLAMGFFRVLGRMGGNIGSLTGADLATLIGDPSGVTLTTTGKNGLSPRRFSGRKTTAGAPTTGTWAVDDEVMDSAGVIWRCTVAGTPGTWASFSGTSVSDTAYDATTWNGVTDVAPSKNAVRDKFESLSAGAVEVIARTVVGVGGAASIVFSSIPATYENLRLSFFGRGDAASADRQVRLRLNGDTGANYTSRGGESSGGSLYVFSEPGVSSAPLGRVSAASAAAGLTGGGNVDFIGYARTVLHKVWTYSSGEEYADFGGGRWASTAAINSITLYLNSGNFAEGSTATLYGIKGA